VSISYADTEHDGEHPETDDSGGPGDPQHAFDPNREQLYISQLKEDIRCLHQLRETYNGRDNGTVRSPSEPPPSSATSHTAHSHVNNVLLMRDRRTSAQGWESSPSSGLDLAAQLRRYNFSSDPAQVLTLEEVAAGIQPYDVCMCVALKIACSGQDTVRGDAGGVTD
jgi:hypothetical protein